MAIASSIIIYLGIILGILDFITDIAYYHSSGQFYNNSLKVACLVFILIQPLWYIFLYVLYIFSHSEVDSRREKIKKLLLTPIYALLQYLKLLPAIEKVHDVFCYFGTFNEKHKLLTLENCYKVSILTELFLESLPQIIIQATNNNSKVSAINSGSLSYSLSANTTSSSNSTSQVANATIPSSNSENHSASWSSIARFSFTISILLFAKDITILTMFAIKKFIDHQHNPQMRPSQGAFRIRKIDKESSLNIQNYLLDPNDEGIDEEGNTSVHQLTKHDDLQAFEQQIRNQPHMLFMLNKAGMTPLDLTILDSDEKKATFLIGKMKEYNINCSLKFVKRPHRLDLKFEKSFCFAIQKNNQTILDQFPPKTIKSVYVSMSQVQDYKKYKSEKSQYHEITTTPLHFACKMSKDEAVHLLIEHHGFDINLILNERNAIYELLSTSTYSDFNILNYLMKRRKVQINSGNRLPLNQAILRGNPFIIKTLIEFGKPNLYVRDFNGKAPIHVAAAKLDLETFDLLIKKGADPMMPDKIGNTILHIMAYGAIRDVEYDFIKEIIERYKMRLTRNAENKTPLNIIRSCSGKPMVLRGQPNFKKKIWEYFEIKSADDPSFVDSDKNELIHEAAINGNLDQLKQEIDKVDMLDGKSTPIIMKLLQKRNPEGKTPLLLSAENNKTDVAMYLLEQFPLLDLDTTDGKEGNTVLHFACIQSNLEIATKIMKEKPKLCLKQNYFGQTPIHLAASKKNVEMLKLFEDFKHDCLLIKDCFGENPLFLCAREGDPELFKWFYGHIDYFRARGDQNYKGQTIEHIVCLAQRHEIVDVIKPRPDTKDYYGNLPIFYSLQNNDSQMIATYFKKNREYFHLRNYKYETVFHIAARYNSLESLQELIGNTVFIEELLKKDYKGDTPIHVAAKSGSYEILEYYTTACTKSFLDLQNDFGFTPKEAVKEKIRLFEEKIHTKGQDEKIQFEGEIKDAYDENNEKLTSEFCSSKLEKLQKTSQYLDKFDNFITEETWAKRFQVSMRVYLDTVADNNLKIFINSNQAVNNSVVNTQSPLKNQKQSIDQI